MPLITGAVVSGALRRRVMTHVNLAWATVIERRLGLNIFNCSGAVTCESNPMDILRLAY